jgi:hypothetical protein
LLLCSQRLKVKFARQTAKPRGAGRPPSPRPKSARRRQRTSP